MADTAEQLRSRLTKAKAERKAAEVAENERIDADWKSRGAAALLAKVEREEALTAQYRKSTQPSASTSSASASSARPRPSNDEE